MHLRLNLEILENLVVLKIVRLNLSCFQRRFAGWQRLHIKCLFELRIAKSSYSTRTYQNSTKSESFNLCHARNDYSNVIFVQAIFSRFCKTKNIVLEVKMERNDLRRKQFCFWHWFMNASLFSITELGLIQTFSLSHR